MILISKKRISKISSMFLYMLMSYAAISTTKSAAEEICQDGENCVTTTRRALTQHEKDLIAFQQLILMEQLARQIENPLIVPDGGGVGEPDKPKETKQQCNDRVDVSIASCQRQVVYASATVGTGICFAAASVATFFGTIIVGKLVFAGCETLNGLNAYDAQTQCGTDGNDYRTQHCPST